jgi:S-layer homology domain
LILPRRARPLLAVAVFLCALLAGGAVRQMQDTCGPFTDVSALFCPYVLEAYYTGITAGTSPTTFSPDIPITRGQAAVFTTKGLNQALARGSRRAALGQWWTPAAVSTLGLTPVGVTPSLAAADGEDIWVTAGDTVVRVQGSDGRVLETWTGAGSATAAVVAMGRVFVTSLSGALLMLDPSQPAGPLTMLASNLGAGSQSLAFDGAKFWTANNSGSVSIVTPGATPPWLSTTVTKGFSKPNGVVFDGSSIWVADGGKGALLRLDAVGNIVQTTPIGSYANFPLFDGENIWVPTGQPDNAVVVVRATTGDVLVTLTGNGLSGPVSAGFDGQRVLVANASSATVSLWDAATLAPLGSFAMPAGSSPFGVCSDGINFWITLDAASQLARF